MLIVDTKYDEQNYANRSLSRELRLLRSQQVIIVHYIVQCPVQGVTEAPLGLCAYRTPGYLYRMDYSVPELLYTPRKSGGIPRVSARFSLSEEDEQADAGRDCRSRLARLSYQARTGTGEFISPVQLTTSRIGNLTRLMLIHTLLYVMTIRISLLQQKAMYCTSCHLQKRGRPWAGMLLCAWSREKSTPGDLLKQTLPGEISRKHSVEWRVIWASPGPEK